MIKAVKTEDVCAKFKENVRIKRLERGLTQCDMADILGTSQPAYSALERGTRVPGLDMIVRISNALDVTIADLLGV